MENKIILNPFDVQWKQITLKVTEFVVLGAPKMVTEVLWVCNVKWVTRVLVINTKYLIIFDYLVGFGTF